MPPTHARPWMKPVLLAAGVYNILWGTWMVLFPLSIFQWLGMKEPNYPEHWQCIGMIVGVYGLGYAIAAYDPMRHWPVILVGWLGKVLGPIGALHGVLTGKLDKNFFMINLTNDLIWWVPFTLILTRRDREFINVNRQFNRSDKRMRAVNLRALFYALRFFSVSIRSAHENLGH